jgi:KaiC/GvpD/RAD55 family RecA-like ATPase
MIGGLFPRGGVSFIFAKAGSKKTWLVQRLASDLSVGGSILDGYVESQPKKVLLFAGESGANIMDRRAKLTDWPVDETNLIVVDALKYDKAGEPLLLDDETGQRRIECLIEEHKPNVVFFDSLLAFHNSNENDGKEMSPIFRYVNALADESNVACVISHHPTKTKRNERKIPLDMDDMIGSSLLNRYAALVVGLEETDIDGGEKMILVSAKKSRHRRPKPFAFALIGMDDGGVRMKINLEPVVGNGAGDKALKFIKENYEPGEDFSNADIRKGGVPISHSYLSECLSKWTEKGILTRSEKTKNARYCLPAEESS